MVWPGFDSPELVALASFQDLYVGLELLLREMVPAKFGLLAALEMHHQREGGGVRACWLVPAGGRGDATPTYRSPSRSLRGSKRPWTKQ